MASLPFDRFYSHIILISFAVHTLIQFNRQTIKPLFNWRTVLLQSVFIVTAGSTIYTINKPEAYSEWGKQITILLFPILFCITGLDVKKYRPQLLLGFSLVCTATIVYLFGDALHTITYYHLPLSTIFSAAFTNHNFAQPIDMHATFFSMQLVIALVYLVTVLVNTYKTCYKIFYLVCICILAAGLFQLCSKSVFFCLFVIVNLVLPYYLLKGKHRWKFMLITASISVLAIAGIYNLKTFRERYVTDLQTDLSKPTANETTDPRLARWDVARGLISRSPIIGYGAGSEIGLLHEVFFEKKYYSSFLNKLNVHNQYLSFLIKSGIIGLLVYISTLTFGFTAAFAKKDLLFLAFMLLITFVSFSENFLDVDKGIFFYAYFFSFFVFSDNKRPGLADAPDITNNAPLEHIYYLDELATN